MNVRCPSCNTVYRIDPAKVPEAGVRARCTVCSHVIPVPRDGQGASSAPTTVAAGTQPVAEPQARRSSQEEIAATLGEAFIAPTGEPGGADSETPVTEAGPPPVPVAPSAEPASPDVAAEPPGPELVRPGEGTPPAAGVGVEAAGPTEVSAGPPPTPVPEAPSPAGGGLRVTRPFSHPGPGRTPSPVQQEQEPQRPTAPVFRPTPGRPLQPASAPPAEPKVTATAPTVAEPAVPVEPAAPPAATVAEPAMPVEPVAPPAATVAEPAMPVEPVAPPAATVAAAPVRTPPAAQPPPADQIAEAAEPAAPPKRVINPFMSRDPKLKARRLARALISDMIVYQPDKRQEALDSGNLKEVFEEEIKKSWEEYVGQVGEEIANSTPYFAEALNEILAGGQPVF